MYKIGELSKLCKIPVKTLRYYDSEGLLIPDKIDKFTGYRYYSASRLSDCNKILALKELGFTLDEIKKQMNAKSLTDILVLIVAKETELNNIKTQTESQLRRLSEVKENIIREDETMYNIIIRSTDTFRVASLRKIYAGRDEAFAEIKKMRAILPQSITGKRNIIINYETEYCEKDFDLAACVEINNKLPKDSEYAEKNITLQSDVATLVCNKNELENAYSAMIKYLEEAPCQIIGAFYEIYHDDDTIELKVPVCRLSRLSDKHKNDDINLPFENDPEAVGKWEFLDVVPSEEQFCPGREKSHSGVWLNELYFLPKGECFWAVAGWTKGYLFTSSDCPKRTYKNKYTIKTVDRQKLLFLEMKDYDHEARGGMPTIWVYKKVSDKEYSRNELSVHDNVDLPFIPDDKILGKWVVHAFVLEADDFNPDKQYFAKEQPFFIKADFKADGTVIETLEPPVNREYIENWTLGTLLDKHCSLAAAYEIKVLDGKEYLFIEWKSGDYQFGGRKPYWYIFVRE